MIPQNIEASTLNSYLSVFDRHINPEFEHMSMQAISSAEITVGAVYDRLLCLRFEIVGASTAHQCLSSNWGICRVLA
jgi:hypothetical protein